MRNLYNENAPATGMARGVEVAVFEGLPGNNTTAHLFDGHVVRVILIGGLPWFVAADVCAALGVKNPTQAIAALDDDERSMLNIGRQGEANIVSESGLYTLTLRSRGATKPGSTAHRFRRWVTGDVLPTVRRTGQYGAPAIPEDLPSALRFAAELAEQKAIAEAERDHAIATKAEIGSKREATAMATASAASRDADRLRKELGRHVESATILAVERAIGRDFPRNAYLLLKAWCLEKGITPSSVPDARWGTVKSWPAGAWLAAFDIDLAELFGKGGEA